MDTGHPSDAQDHDFGGFDEGGGAVTGLEAKFPGGVRRDDGSDVLLADGERNLGKQAAKFHFKHAADELIASADSAEVAAASFEAAAFEFSGDEAVDFAFGDAVVATGSLDGLNFFAIDPLFEGGIADAQDVGGFARGEKFLHEDEDRRF